MKFFKIFILFPLSLIYGFVTRVRNTLYDIQILKSTEFDVPVISIGNITVGGTGKTPMTELLVKCLKNDYNIAVLSRGYKRKTKGFIIADNNSTVNQIGDEPLQIKKKFPGVTVAVDENRVKGIKKILNNDKDISLIVLDDAFQHRRIKPGLSILLSDYNHPMLDDHFLPYGRLRESISELHRAHLIIITKTPKTVKPIDMRVITENYKIKPYQTIYFSALKYDNIQPVFPNKKGTNNLREISGNTALLITGIANSEPMIEYIEKTINKLIHLKFRDHHSFSKKDIIKIKIKFDTIDDASKIVITTEKDALRLRMHEKNFSVELKDKMYFLPVGVKFVSPEIKVFKEQLQSYIKTSTANNTFFASRRNF